MGTSSRVRADIAARTSEPKAQAARAEVERILDAAWRVLRRSNWQSVKLEAVLTESGLSMRAFYRHFRSKDEMLIAMIEEEVGAAESRFATVLAGEDDPVERLRSWLTIELTLAYAPNIHLRTRAFARVWGLLQSEFPERFQTIMERLIIPLQETLADGKACGRFPDTHPERDAVAIFLLTNGFMLEALAGRPWMTEEEAREVVMRFALGAVGAAQTTS